jgi:magnesium-transporting ATPase (P-type)
MTKWTRFVSVLSSVERLCLIMVCIVAGLPMPLLPIHLLWINLVSDGLPALCLAIDPIDSELACCEQR